jgi:hypothetical protein
MRWAGSCLAAAAAAVAARAVLAVGGVQVGAIALADVLDGAANLGAAVVGGDVHHLDKHCGMVGTELLGRAHVHDEPVHSDSRCCGLGGEGRTRRTRREGGYGGPRRLLGAARLHSGCTRCAPRADTDVEAAGAAAAAAALAAAPAAGPTWVSHRQNLGDLLHLHVVRVLSREAQVVADLRSSGGSTKGRSQGGSGDGGDGGKGVPPHGTSGPGAAPRPRRLSADCRRTSKRLPNAQQYPTSRGNQLTI